MASIVLFSASTLIAADAPQLPAAVKISVDFREDVYPILTKHCYRCHQGSEASSGYRLDDRREILGKTNGVPVVQLKKSSESRLIHVVAGLDNEVVMPPEGPRLSAKEVGILRAWIDQGLIWDETLLPRVLAKSDHWSFQPLIRPDMPDLEDRNWVRNPIDAFVAAKQKEIGLAPAADASQRTLIRRLSLDLLGLPPTTAQVDQFLSDSSDRAYEHLVERLLASPHYGERWGRHWLDISRWAESEGYESNHPRRFAWRYRDYVIDSFNQDRPYDEFVRQQLAGDELVPYSDENMIATGFLAAGRISSNEEDKWLQRNDVNVDIVNATASTFLGLTINCAQCHNHKFDPISTRDYYRLQGFFLKGQPIDVRLQEEKYRRVYESQRPSEYEPTLKLKQALFEKARASMIVDVRSKISREELSAYDIPSDRRTLDQELIARKVDLKFQRTPKGIEKFLPKDDRKLYEELKKKLSAIEKTSPVIPQTFAYYSPVTSPHRIEILPTIGFYPLPFDPDAFRRATPYLMIRGDVHAIGPSVEPGWPEVFDAVFKFPKHNSKADMAGRTLLADWLTHPKHPLSARVWVNRIWHYHFGRGIVASTGDFGVKGARPTHPKLLDWLASELIENGWSTKHIHRLIVTSSTYRQSSQVNTRSVQLDPENAFLSHWQPRRLEVETIRDAILAVTGTLDRTSSGESVSLDKRDTSDRRSIYLFQKRGVPPEMQMLFDGPVEASDSCSRRNTSTTALQSLYLLNSDFVLDRAKQLAASLLKDAPKNRRQLIERAFLLVLSRPPAEQEIAAANRFLDSQRATGETVTEMNKGTAEPPLVLFCHALLNLTEFVYLE